MSNQYSGGCSYNYRRSMPGSNPGAALMSTAVQNETAGARAGLFQNRINEGSGNRNNSECNIDGCPIAMAYVPYQEWSRPLQPCRGLQLGTIFADLNKPFCGRGGAGR